MAARSSAVRITEQEIRNETALRQGGLATEDVEVPPPDMGGFDLAAFADEASRVDPHGTDMDATIEKMSKARAAKAKPVTDIREALEAAGQRAKAQQSASRKAKGTATTKATPKKATPKEAAPKAKAAAKPSVERVPAAEVIALIDQLGITRAQLAKATGKSPSLVTEWVGKGRGHLVARSEWKAIEAAARKFAEGLK
jgi:hypothetical protein